MAFNAWIKSIQHVERGCKMEQITGQVVKVQTTVDECVRVTVDIDTSLIPENVNVLKWKNNMVLILMGEAKE